MPKTPTALRLQRRDLEVLAEIGDVGILDTPTIHERYFSQDRSGQACRRRLRLYAKNGLTEPVYLSVASANRRGRLATMYRLTPLGADTVAEETGVRPLRPGRSSPPRPQTLLHRVGMAKVQLTLTDACRLHGLPKPEWIGEYDAVPGIPLSAPFSKRFILCHEFASAGKRRVCWPDGASLLTIPGGAESWRLGILWEYDRATEGRKQIAEKMEGYEPLLKTQAYRAYWPSVQGVRVFFVVPSEARLQSIIEAIQRYPASAAVRLAIARDLWAESLLALPVWRTVTGECRSILTLGGWSKPQRTITCK